MMNRVLFSSFHFLASLAIWATGAHAAEPDHVLAAMQGIDPDIRADHYEAKHADLDDDGSKEALVLMNGKSGYCGSGGCTLFVLKPTDGKLAKAGAIKVVRPPIHLRQSTHHGMRDLLVYSSGGGVDGHHASLAFDGTSYPASPGTDAAKVLPTDTLLFPDPDAAQPPEEQPPAPARLTPGDLAGIDQLSAPRRKLIERALALGNDYHLNQYIFGSADPKRGGFDCSGAMFYLLQESGLQPARSSANQYDWIKEAGLLTVVPPTINSLEDKVFKTLQPGDLLFWSGTYKPTDGRTNGVTHVQIYLGKEKKDGRMVMAGSSDGRSYRGKRQCGYGVFDFRLPRPGSKSHFAGFGPPPGLVPADE